jgi:outer membrane protein, heavy metal efflux system
MRYESGEKEVTRKILSSTALLLAATLASACRAPSPASDARAIEAVAPIEHVDRVLSQPVDLEGSPEARELLEHPLSQEDAVSVALTSNREIQASLHEVGIARGTWMQSRLLPNPVAEVELLPERESTLELRLEYDLTEALLAPARARTAAPLVEAARYRAAASIVNTSAAVRRGFVRLQVAQLRLDGARQILETLAAERDAAEALSSSGNVPELSLATRLASHETARSMVAQLEINEMDAREGLIALLGLSGDDTGFSMSAALPDVPQSLDVPSEAESLVVAKNLSLLASKKMLDGVGAQTGYLRAKGNTPEVSVDVHLLWQDPKDDPPGERDQAWRVGGGLSTTLPFFDRQQGNVKSTESDFDARLARYLGNAAELRSTVRRNVGRLRGAHARFVHLNSIVLPAQRVLSDQLLLQYNAMQADVFALLSAKRAEIVVEQLRLDAHEEFLLAQVQLDALLLGGNPETLALSMPNAPENNSDAGH